MRLLVSTLLASILAAFYFHRRGVHTNTKLGIQNIFFYYNGDAPNIPHYRELLRDLRIRLAFGPEVRGTLRTRRPDDIPADELFIRVQLQNNNNQAINAIIDTRNIYGRGYVVERPGAARPTFYHLRDIPDDVLPSFPETIFDRIQLNFTGNYEGGGLPPRGNQQLGHAALNEAIGNLYDNPSYDQQRSGMLVIIQMVSEAVRIRYMELRIVQNMRNGRNFVPDVVAMTTENRWSNLSEQIQRAGPSGAFDREVQIQDLSYRFFPIRSVDEAMLAARLYIMLYDCNNPNGITALANGADGQCPISEPTTNIIGRDGLCIEVSNSNYTDGNTVVLGKCVEDRINQLWTFKYDGTIRSNGKCLAALYTSYQAEYTKIYDCEKSWYMKTKWVIYDGTIINKYSGLVLTATPDLMIAMNTNSSKQAYSVGNHTQHNIRYIMGFSDMCLQANGVNTRVWLVNCVTHTEYMQQWAFYGDHTIRLYGDRTLCVTSDGHASEATILLKTCEGSVNQRWTFLADGTILNPNARLVMDVKESDVSLHEIILFKPTGNPNQNWLSF